MPPSQYHKPETALSKARELIKCEKKLNALEILYDVMRARRSKNWQKVLEDLMMLFVELCVDLRKNIHFRKAIYQYKNTSMLENTASLEQVIRFYLSQIKTKTEEAQSESENVIMDVDDLDVLETPESLMLNAVSLECTQDRSARTILMPWLKFLWDSYRLVFDLLRGNAKLEKLYHEVAKNAYEFCVKYGRKTEFKKICEMLRQHTQKVQNQSQPNAPNAINLNNTETQNMHLETRLKQFDCAMQLEMYNEAFKTIEDMWNFIFSMRKQSNPALLCNYYTRCLELFERCGCHLYHAAALQKLFTFRRDLSKTVTSDQLAQLGARALCATLAVPLPNAKSNADKFLVSGEYTMPKQKTLASLLNLNQVPTRQQLIRDLGRHQIPNSVAPELSKLYTILENDFQPLNLWQSIQPSLAYMEQHDDLKIYTTQLHSIVVAKTLLQLSQVYQSLKFDEFFKLCPFMHPIRLERCIFELIRNLELPIRVNHLAQAIFFDKFTDLGISQCEYGGQLVSQSTHVNDPDKLSRQLTMFAHVMQQITDTLDSNQSLAHCRHALLTYYRQHEQEIHDDLTRRFYIIEQRKEEIETLRMKQDQDFSMEEARRQAEQERLLQTEEQNLVKEAEERERMKAEDEKARIKRRIAQESYSLFLEHKIGSKLVDTKELTEEQLDQFDADKMLEKKALEVKKKRKELMEKSKSMAKKLDYFTRALRLEEIPLLQAQVGPELDEAKVLFEKTMKELEENSLIEHTRQVKERNRLIRMKLDVKGLVTELKDIRDKKYKVQLAEWEAMCSQVRVKRLAERKEEAIRRENEEKIHQAEAERLRQLEAEAEKTKQERDATDRSDRDFTHRDDESRNPFRSRAFEPRNSDIPDRNDQPTVWARGQTIKIASAATNQSFHEEETKEAWVVPGYRKAADTERKPFNRGFGNAQRGFRPSFNTDNDRTSQPWRRNELTVASSNNQNTNEGGGFSAFRGSNLNARLSGTPTNNEKKQW